MNDDRSAFRLTPRLVLGLGVVLVGLIWTANNLDLVEADRFLDYWPLILVAVGATKIGGDQQSDKVFALFWIGLGLWLLAWNLDYIELSPIEVFWPVVLILLGLSLVFGALRRKRPAPTSDSRVNIVTVMGGVDRTNSSSDFLGGDVTVFMGGGELDLGQATIETEAVIQVFALWGGYEFQVPADWNISLELLPLLAGVEDKRTHRERRDGAPTLVIKGVVIMGGVEVTTSSGGRTGNRP
jgi:predicted membrane protein